MLYVRNYVRNCTFFRTDSYSLLCQLSSNSLWRFLNVTCYATWYSLIQYGSPILIWLDDLVNHLLDWAFEDSSLEVQVNSVPSSSFIPIFGIFGTFHLQNNVTGCYEYISAAPCNRNFSKSWNYCTLRKLNLYGKSYFVDTWVVKLIFV